MQCLSCQQDNGEEMAKCTRCGSSLVPARVNLYLERARTALDNARFEMAEAQLNLADVEMLKLNKRERDQRLFTARAFLVQAGIYYAGGRIPAAKDELLLAVDGLSSEEGGKELLARALGWLGNITYYQGETSASLEYYARSTALARENGAHAVAARTLTNIGSIHIEQGDVDEGRASYDVALAEASLSADADTIAQVYRLLAWYHGSYGPFPLALEYIEKMLALKEQATSVLSRALIYGEAANIYAWQGELEQAAGYASEAYTLAQQSGSEVAKEHAALAITELLRQGSSADDWLVKALNVLAGPVRGAMMKREVALHLAICYIFEGDELHIRRYLTALKESESNKANDERTASLIDHAEGLLYAALGDWEMSAQHFVAARERGRLTTYETAVLWQEYGEMLQRRTAKNNDAAAVSEASKALDTAAAIFAQLGLTQRAAKLAPRLL